MRGSTGPNTPSTGRLLASWGSPRRLHTPPHGVELYEESAFDWGAWQAWDAARAFADDAFVFTVIQSIGGAPTDWVAEQVEPFLKVNDSSRG